MQTRKRLGAWYTPPALVDHVLDTVLDPVLAGRPSGDGLRILDPACGDGRFLVAAGERVRRRFGRVPDGCLTGVDIDRAAVAVAAAALGPGADLRTGDALDGAVPAGPFDVVVGNPPFLNQLAAGTSRGGRSRWGGGAYADTAALFLSLALHAAPARRRAVGLVLPHRSSPRDTPRHPRRLPAGARLDVVVGGRTVFDADVLTCVSPSCGASRRRPCAGPMVPASTPCPTPPARISPGGRRGATSAPTPPASRRCRWATAPPLAGWLRPRPTRDQYYGLVPHVTDAGDGAPLVTAGLLDVGRCGGARGRPASPAPPSPRRRVDALARPCRRGPPGRLVPKVLVATQTRAARGGRRSEGAWLPSVPVITVVPHDPTDLWRVGAVLCAGHDGGAGGRHSTRRRPVGARHQAQCPQVLDVLLPDRPWDGAADALAVGDVEECARRMDVAYGTDLYDWWDGRRASRRSR